MTIFPYLEGIAFLTIITLAISIDVTSFMLFLRHRPLPAWFIRYSVGAFAISSCLLIMTIVPTEQALATLPAAHRADFFLCSAIGALAPPTAWLAYYVDRRFGPAHMPGLNAKLGLAIMAATVALAAAGSLISDTRSTLLLLSIFCVNTTIPLTTAPFYNFHLARQRKSASSLHPLPITATR